MTWEIKLEDVALIVTIVGAFGGWFHYIVIKPLKEAIKDAVFSLKEKMEELTNEIRMF